MIVSLYSRKPHSTWAFIGYFDINAVFATARRCIDSGENIQILKSSDKASPTPKPVDNSNQAEDKPLDFLKKKRGPRSPYTRREAKPGLNP